MFLFEKFRKEEKTYSKIVNINFNYSYFFHLGYNIFS